MSIESKNSGPYRDEEFPEIHFEEYNEMDKDTFYNVARKADREGAAGSAEFFQLQHLALKAEKEKKYSPDLQRFFKFSHLSVFYFFGGILPGGTLTSAYVPYIKVEGNKLVFGKRKFSKIVNGGPRWDHVNDVAVMLSN